MRVSGPAAFDSAVRIAGQLPEARRASLRQFVGEDGMHLDTGLLIAFPAPESFTGEDAVEFHVHGGVATVAAMLEELGGHSGLRMAEPGEFTLRALLNGRMDIAEVEGLGDLISAETEVQRRQAIRLFSGDLGAKVEAWRGSLIHCAAMLEAPMEFADEEISDDVHRDAARSINDVLSVLRAEATGVMAAERLREGFEVAIVGAPNTGKSTLLNHLAGREAAITSELAGTTRDVIEVRMDVEGLPVTFLDMAGIRETEDSIETMGVAIARARARDADLRVFLLDGRCPLDLDVAMTDDDLTLQCKADLLPRITSEAVSGKTGAGVRGMLREIGRILGARADSAGTAVNARHRKALQDAIFCLENADRELNENGRGEIAAEEVRYAMSRLEKITGRIDIEHVLGEIFSNFCIGK